MSETRSVSIILPAYNNRTLLEENLPLVMAAIAERGGEDEVIVADDGGSDDTQAFLARAFPDVRYVRNPVNGGFGAACNAGIAVSRCPYILLLNTDVKVPTGFLDPLLAHFDRPDVFSVVPRVIRPGDPPECQSVTSYHCARGFFQLLWEEQPAATAPKPVLFPCGACALFDAARLKEVGGLDPLYRPFYMEDVDLGYIAWKRGWVCLYEPSVTVWHEESTTVLKTVDARRKSILGMRNHYLFVWKNLSDRRFLAAHLLLMPLRGVSALIRRRDPVLLQGLFAALPRLGEALAARRREQPQATRTDREIAGLFQAGAS
ncbi:MAG TPA: glycosyltransferase family 2 protein [Chthonomonadaceae bacterium]|nr:glycosyltransferase family 2 protein [Chthonomonadaceae bacterium]